jgi:hypothetical protein
MAGGIGMQAVGEKCFLVQERRPGIDNLQPFVTATFMILGITPSTMVLSECVVVSEAETRVVKIGGGIQRIMFGREVMVKKVSTISA